MSYVPLNLDVYTAAYAGAIAGAGVPSGAYIVDPVEGDYLPITEVATVFAQAVDTAWGAVSANTYDIEAITDASTNIFVKGAGHPIGGLVITQGNWTIVATALVALIREGDAAAAGGGIVFPPIPSGASPFPRKSHILCISSVFGSDTTGDGSMSNPYATIAKAYAVALADLQPPTVNRIWEVIIFPGVYTEDVAIRPFINLVGWESSNNTTGFYPARITGTFTLHSSYSTAGSDALLTNLDIDGTVTLNFVTTVSSDGAVSFTNCQIELGQILVMNAGTSVEYHDCVYFDNLEQIGGVLSIYNTTTINSNISTLGLEGTATVFIARNSSFDFDSSFTADTSALTTGSLNVSLFNSSVGGEFTIVSSATVEPVIISEYGAIIENAVLTGAVAGLQNQMRIKEQFSINTGATITGAAVSAFPFTVTPALLGTTSIEALLNTANCIGAGWTPIFETAGCSVSFQFVRTGGDNLVIVNIYNPGITFTTADNLIINYGGYFAFPLPR